MRIAQQLGHLRRVKYLLALLAVIDNQSFEQVACVLKLNVKTVHEWVRLFLCYGTKGAPRRHSPGRPPKLTKAHKAELACLIEAGPQAAGYSAGGWRTPLVQQLIQDRFGVLYNVFYLAQLLKDLGFSWQKAKFVSDHLDEAKRHEWQQKTWPHRLGVARRRGALLLFGDEASFPQWGPLAYTWARRGEQPVVKTRGKRKGYKSLRAD